MVFMWKFLDSGSTEKSGVRTFNFSSGTENQTRLQELMKKARPETRYICLRMRITQGPL
jgi:hypothetical protein